MIKKQRSLLIDNMKGILIFLVVFAHFLLFYVEAGVTGIGITFINNYIYIFHMPLFVFISGYLSKNIEKGEESAFNKLLVPFLIFNTFMSIYSVWRLDLAFDPFTPIYSYWYLLALFTWRATLRYIVKIKYIIVFSFLAGLLIGFFSPITNFLAMTRIIALLPFFLLGYYCKEAILLKIKKINIWTVVVLLLVSVLAVFQLSGSGLTTSIFVMNPYGDPWLVFLRIFMYVIATIIAIAFIRLTPNKEIIFITKAGKYSLYIFVLHRFFNFVFYDIIHSKNWLDIYIVLCFIASILVVYILGNAHVEKLYNLIIGKVKDRKKWNKYALATIGIILILSFGPSTSKDEETNIRPYTKHVMNEELIKKIDESITISFIGDVIMLEDQVKRGYDAESNTYNFDSMFEYAKKYLTESDYAIAVLEQPLAGKEAGYSTSNYDDGIPLYLNAPDELADSLKNAGIDLVTTANNHALDKGIDGLYRTLDIIDSIGLNHIGTYRNKKEQYTPFITEIGELKVAFVAYSYGTNYYHNDFFAGSYSHLMNILEDEKKVIEDIKRAKKLNPDLIIALPHMGTQFSHESDAFSRKWSDIMFEAGVDIILANHSHSVQPIEYRTINKNGMDKTGVVVYSPGNFINSYVDHNGDATAIVNIHISASGDIIASSIIPMYTYCSTGELCQALPIYDLISREVERISALELTRVQEVQRIITETMLGMSVSLDELQPRYYYFPDLGYVRHKVDARLKANVDVETLDDDRRRLYNLINEADTIVLIGDSITEGSFNGGYGWFEPIEAIFPDKKIINNGIGGMTTKQVIAMGDMLNTEGDLFIIALGTNDVRYRDEIICSMTSKDYVRDMNDLVSRIKEKNLDAEIVFINAWLAFHNDQVSQVEETKRDMMIDDYNDKLEEYAKDYGYVFIDANTPIRRYLGIHVTRDYILDYIHPNANRGIKLYANAVLFGEYKNWLIE